MLILSSFPTLPLSGKRLTGFGTLTTPSEDGIRLPQFHRASPSTALDKKRKHRISYMPLEVKAVPPPDLPHQMNRKFQFSSRPLQSGYVKPTLLRSGKVRDIYRWQNQIWLVASDRISAYDVILPNPIPGKGTLLTSISKFWFETLPDAQPHHVLGFDVPSGVPSPEIYQGRLTRCLSAKPLILECVIRGYLAGSAWEEYKTKGSLWGRPLPKGLLESSKLSQPIFTPTTKAEKGHDLPVTDSEAEKQIGSALFHQVRDRSLSLYTAAQKHAEKAGIILADTKFEFGTDDKGNLLLIDELLTPDSSRFWPANQWKPGQNPPSYDKQFVRDYLAGLEGWDRKPPGPSLPPPVIQGTLQRYEEACQLLTGSKPSLRNA